MNQAGASLVMVLVVAAIFAIAIAVTYRAMISTIKKTGSFRASAQLINIAEAGKEDALAELRHGDAVPLAGATVTIFNAKPFANGAYSVSCRANGDATMLWLLSAGLLGEQTKTIEAEFRVTPCPLETYQGTPHGSPAEKSNENNGGACPCQCADASRIGGSININPNNSDNEFVLTLSSGVTITRDNLQNGTVTGFQGTVASIHVKPKGNQNQNSLTVNGSPYSIDNSTTYDITATDMAVNLYQDGNGQGLWYVEITASDAHIGNAGTDGGCSCECTGNPSPVCAKPTYTQTGWRELN
jgi:hypothetical protein